VSGLWTKLTEYTLFHNTIGDYLISLAIFIVGSFLLRSIKKFLLLKLRQWADRTNKDLFAFLIKSGEQNLLPLIYLGVFYTSIYRLNLSPLWANIVNYVSLSLTVIFSVRFILSLFTCGLEYYFHKPEADSSKRYIFMLISKILTFVVWALTVVILLDNLGVQISALVTGLGIGGIAVALASQVLLSDLFSYFTIYIDRPFEIGDYIVIDGFSGTVENVGLKTTRLRSITGEELIFSNTDLTSSRLRNYKRMKRRRISFTIRVSYQTDAAQIKEIPKLLAGIITNMPNTELNRSHFSGFGDYGLNFDVVYYVLTRDYIAYMDIQEEINLKIIDEFSKRGINFTYPTQTLYVKRG
jgi:small-conductance mechanosensitive channel